MRKSILFLIVISIAILVTISCNKKNATELKIEPPGPVTDIDGNVYQTVRIGNQIWMAENLRVTRYRNGDALPNVTWGWQNISEGAYCYYDNNASNIAVYGFLYNGFAVQDDRKIAPEGWRVPTDEDWKKLEMFLGMSRANADSRVDRGTDEGGKLKESGTEHWASPNTGATNECGFSALPGGYCRPFLNNDFHRMDSTACFWASTGPESNRLWYRELSYETSDIMRHYTFLPGYSIRCIKGPEGVIPPEADFSVTPETGTTETVFTVDASNSSDTEDSEDVLQVHWDWENDGTWDTDYITRKTATHQYTTAGTKTIKLEIKDTDGLTDTTTKQITVETHEPPIASFTVSPPSGITGTMFSFDASSCSDNKDAVYLLEVRWDWENDEVWDTNYSSNKTATHQYITEGTKTINLEVKDTEGLTGSTTQKIIVSDTNTGTMTDQDGNLYQTVLIGNQWWMAENLKAIHYRNGDAIPNVSDSTEWVNLTTGAYSAYDNNESNAETYGYLYNWYAVDDTRNIAPEGWHIPTETEWQTLIDYLGGVSVAGGKMKEAGTIHWASPNDGATNESGFTALPGGRFPTEIYEFLQIYFSASFWSSTEIIEDVWTAWGYTLFHTTHPYLPELTGGAISPWDDPKYFGFSIRCIKDW